MKIVFTLISLLFCLSLSSQSYESLKGTIIGSTYSADYTVSGGVQSTTVNTKNNVFDNNLDTYFAAYDRSGGWVGLDLGKQCIIKQVSFASRKSYANRLALGIIEGANNPDFGDAIPIYIIKSAPQDGVMTTVNISCSRSFRYVRYVGPNNVRCNIAELHFFGVEGEGDDSQLYQITNIPVVVIHTTNSEDILSKENYVKGIVSIISKNGKKFYTDSLNIRGRGNASWAFPKKPYRMKLFNSTKLLDFPAKAKNWTLINNYSDKTLMRNLIAFEISKRFKMKYTPSGTPVDVILNGEYKGCYQLCDQIEVKKDRIDITEMTNDDLSLPNLSGGYYVEIDAYAHQEISWFESALLKIPVTIKSPKDDEIVGAQTAYIRNYFNQLENTVLGSWYNDPTKGYRSILDLESFLKNFLIGELCGNTDTFWSVNMSKDRGSDKFYTGPIWDFDIAFENDNRTYPINSLSDFIFRTKGSCANGMKTFASRIINTSSKEQKDIWSDARISGNINAESLLSFIDSTANVINESQELNFKRWPILNDYIQKNPMIYGSYAGEVSAVKDFLKNRIVWMDNKMNFELPTSNAEVHSSNGIICAGNGSVSVNGFVSGSVISVYNLSGQQVMAKILSSGNADFSLNAGFYIVKITKGSEQLALQKLIVR